MKRDEVKAIFAEATDEQINELMKLNNSSIEQFKQRNSELEKKISEQGDELKKLEEFKENHSKSENWKEKFEKLQGEIAEKEEKEKEAREKAEHDANILKRYEAAATDKDGKPLKWTHDDIKSGYLNKFTEAVSKKENEGKSDKDILTELMDGDNVAIESPSAETVFSGAGNVSIGDMDDAQINAIMGIS